MRLSSSIYLDSDGVFSTGAAAGIPVVSSHQLSFPVDPAKVKDTLQSVADGIKKFTDPASSDSILLRRLGIDGVVLDTLKQMGKLTAQLAKFVPYVGAAIQVLEAFGILSSGGPSLDPAIKQRFAQLNEIIIANQRQWADVTAAGFQNRVLTALDSAKGYVEQTKTWESVPAGQIDWTVQDTRRDRLVADAVDAYTDLSTFLTPELWMPFIQGRDPDDPQHTFDPLRPLTLSLPDENGVWHWAPPEKVGLNPQFDHRVMVHVVPALVGCYLTTLRALLPEYRSIGTFRGKLLGIADQVDRLLVKMRTVNLARTDFTEADVTDYVDFGPFTPTIRLDVAQAAKAQAFWHDLVRHYSISRQPGPEDPITRLGSASLRSAEQRAAVEAAFRAEEPELLAEEIGRVVPQP